MALPISIGVGWYLIQFSNRQTVQASLESAASLASQVREVRGYYTKNVVSHAKNNGLAVSHDYADRDDAIPLPATMVHELTEVLNAKEGYNVRLYSAFPFPWRTDGGARDAFEEEALAVLAQNQDAPFWRRETLDGKEVIRYATADPMVAQGCVNCHNAHPQTPKDDWKVGDLRGVIQIIMPVDEALIRAEEEAINIGVGIALALIVALALAGYSASRTLMPLGVLGHRARSIADGDLKQDPIDIHSRDEIGQLSETFNDMLAGLQQVVVQAEGIAAGRLDSAAVVDKMKRGESFEEAVAFVNGANQKTSGDLAEAFDKMTAALRKLTVQAQAIAGDDLDNAVLDVEVPGELGDAFHDMIERMKWLSGQATYIANDDLYNSELRAEGEGTMGSAMARMVVNLRQVQQDLKAQTDAALERQKHVLGVAGQVLDAANGVSAATDQLASRSRELAAGSDEQKQTVAGTASSVEELAASARGIAENTDELARLITENSAALNQLSASVAAVTQNSQQMSSTVVANSSAIEELAASIQTQADGAAQANQTASEASQAAQEGADVVRQAIVAMERIAEQVRSSSSTIQELGKSSAQISTIVAVINDIADQTNLLALNAAIEAARAGEQGKGFMVVADEVRKLAERTSQATQEIDQMIGKIQTDTQEVVSSMEAGMGEVEQGTELAAQSGEALGQIGEGVERVNALMGQLTEASREQATTSDEIVRAMAEMNELVQQVAGAMGEQAQAVEVVSQSSEEMQTQVDQVSASVREQTQTSTAVSRSMEEATQTADAALASSQDMSASTDDLAHQAEQLKALANSFQNGDDETSDTNGEVAVGQTSREN